MVLQAGENISIHTIDLNFQGRVGAIAVYLIAHKNGAILVEGGPGSTIPELTSGLNRLGFSARDVSDVLLTHIHLDHAGASGWLAEQGATIHVHPIGAPHLNNPEKLLKSAGRIYGDQMKPLWGEFLPVAEDKIVIHQDHEMIEIDEVKIRALETPGHASHHFAYLLNGICFCGDIGGVRVGGVRHIRLPMAPPEFQPMLWRESLDRLRAEEISHLVPTHFGVYDDVDWQIRTTQQALDSVEGWIENTMTPELTTEELNTELISWERKRSHDDGIDVEMLKVFEIANPTLISALGIQRYWRKYHQAD